MNCESFEARLNQLLDSRSAFESDAQLLGHAAGCRECRELLAAEATLFEGMGGRSLPDLRADLAERVLDEFQQPAIVRFAPPRWALAAAAAVMLLVGLPAAWRALHQNEAERVAEAPVAAPVAAEAVARPSELEPREAIAERAADADGAVAPAGEEEPIGPLLAEMGTKYVDLARETQQSLAEVALLLPIVGLRGSKALADAAPVEAEAEQRPAAAKPEESWVGEVAEGLRPITNSTAGALNQMLQALVFDTDESRS